MSLSPSGMIDRASAEITRCIMRIKKKRDAGTNTTTTITTTNNTNTNTNHSHSNAAPTNNGGTSAPVNNPSPNTTSTTTTNTTTTSHSLKQTNSQSPQDKQPQQHSSSAESNNSKQHNNSSTVSSSAGSGTPQKKPLMSSQMGLGNIIMLGTPRKLLNHSNSNSGGTGSGSSSSSSSSSCAVGVGGGGSGTNGSSNNPTQSSPRFRHNLIITNFSYNTHPSSNGQHPPPLLPQQQQPQQQQQQQQQQPPLNLLMDSQFLSYLFQKYFHGLDKLVLPLVCKFWRDTTYSLGKEHWDHELVPVLNCKEIRHELLNCAGVRRRFYTALRKRGFTGLKLVGASDEDAEDVHIHFSQGSSLIQTLKLCNSSLTDKGLYSLLDHLSSVDHLELVSCNEITEEGIIKALPLHLSVVVILDCIHVADLVFSALAKLQSLHSFTIQAYHVTDSALSSFNSKVNSNLSTLKLNSCWELTNQALLHIVSSLPHLETLSLSGCSKVTDEGVEILAENLNVLKSLDLSWCSRITDSSLECIACDLVSLQQLILDRCTLITDMGVGYLATMSSLRLLSIRWCSNIRDQAIHHIISIKKLQYLSIAGCTNISSGTLCSLSTLRELRELELTNCGVTPSVIQFLRNTLQYCVVIE